MDEIKLIKLDNDYRLELWGASTKHPDSIFYFSRWENADYLFTMDEQLFQWLCYCASCMRFSYHAKQIINFAIDERGKND